MAVLAPLARPPTPQPRAQAQAETEGGGRRAGLCLGLGNRRGDGSGSRCSCERALGVWRGPGAAVLLLVGFQGRHYGIPTTDSAWERRAVATTTPGTHEGCNHRGEVDSTAGAGALKCHSVGPGTQPADRWEEIWQLNRERIANPHLVFPGLVLLMP